MKLPVKYTLLSPGKRRIAREQYVRQQGGKCCFCGALLSGPPSSEVRHKKLDLSLFPPGFLKYPVHLHHSHATDLTIGAIHSHCNGVLWQYYGI